MNYNLVKTKDGYLVPLMMTLMTKGQIDRQANGCGPDWKIFKLFDFIPDKYLGVNFTDDCNCHDIMYAMGINVKDKYMADETLKINMSHRVDLSKKGIIIRSILKMIIALFFYEVHFRGLPFFASAKFKPDSVCEALYRKYHL